MQYRSRWNVLMLVFLVFAAMTSCESFWNVVLGEEQNPNPIPIESKSVDKHNKSFDQNSEQNQKPDFSEADRMQVCLEDIKNHTSIKKLESENDHDISIEIETNRIYDDLSLAKWMQEFAEDVFYTRDCPINRIQFIAGVTEESFYKGVVSRSDFDFFHKGKISDAELYRRFDIRKTETEYSLKIQLVEKRKNKANLDALEIVKKLQETDSENPTLKIIQANIYRDQKAYAEAINLYQVLSEVLPDDVGVLVNFAYVEKEMGNFPSAVLHFKKALELIQSKGVTDVISVDDLRLMLADAYFKNRELNLCQEQLDAITDSGRQYAYNVLHSNILRLEKKYDESLAVLTNMENNGTADDLVLFNKILLYLDLHDEVMAKQSYEILKQNKPAYARELSFLKIFGGDDSASSSEATSSDSGSGVQSTDTQSNVLTPIVPQTVDPEQDGNTSDTEPSTNKNPDAGEEEMESLF